MSQPIRVDYDGMRVLTTSLNGLSVGPARDFDLSPMRSDLVTSAASVFSDRWTDVVAALEWSTSGLAGAIDETASDFVAAEQESINALVDYVASLDT